MRKAGSRPKDSTQPQHRPRGLEPGDARQSQTHTGPLSICVVAMDRTAKLYRLYVELAVVKRSLEGFAAFRPNPRQWTPEEVAPQGSLVKRRTDIRAAIAELESFHAHRRR